MSALAQIIEPDSDYAEIEAYWRDPVAWNASIRAEKNAIFAAHDAQARAVQEARWVREAASYHAALERSAGL